MVIISWELGAGIVGFIITLASFMITLVNAFTKSVKEQSKNNEAQIETLTKLGTSFEGLSETFKEFKNDIKQDLKEIKDKVENHGERIVVIESNIKKNKK